MGKNKDFRRKDVDDYDHSLPESHLPRLQSSESNMDYEMQVLLT